MRRVLRPSAAFAVLVVAAFTSAATDVRVETRVDPRVRAQVAAIVDSLQDEGLHPEPLVQYALEGTGKGGRPEVILAGVKRWATDLRHARTILGPAATPDEVNAGAKALRAGAREDELRRFREARIDQRYAAALNTIAFLVNDGAPSDTVSRVVVNLTLAGVSDAQLRQLQDDVIRDRSAGIASGSSIIARAIGVLQAIEAGAPDGVTPGAALPSTRGTARPADPMATGGLRGSALGNKGEVIRPPAPRGKDSKRP